LTVDGVRIAIVVAMARNRVIGRDNGMPWRLSSDMKHFKATTMGKPMIMGRKTFQSIGKPLPGRHTIVVTRDSGFKPEGVETVATLDAAFDAARKAAGEMGAGEIIVAGGGVLYAEAMERADRLYVTHVDAEPDGDTVFPEIDPAVWEAVEERDIPQTERDSAKIRFVAYKRIP